MTDYNGEQNNIIGMAQPTDAQPIIPTEPQAAVAPVESQIAVSEVPVSEASAPAQIQPTSPVYQAPAQLQPTTPVNQAPVIPPTAPQPPKNSKAPIFIGIGIFLVGVIIALILVFVLVGNNSDEDEKSKGNKTETEQTEDKPSSEDDNDEDEDNKDADEDKDNTDKGNSDKDDSDKDTSSEDDKTDKDDEDEKVDDDDTPVDAVVDAPYAGYLDSFAGMFMGDLSGIGDILPKGMWDLMRFALSEELGYMPTKEEVVEIMFEEALAAEGDEEIFLDKSGYTIISQEDVDEATIEKLQEGLANYMIFDEIEEAYKITFSLDLEERGESISVEDTAYAVYVDDEWTFMSVNYDIYIVDCTILDEMYELGDMFGEGFI